MHWLSTLNMVLESVQDRVFELQERPKKSSIKESRCTKKYVWMKHNGIYFRFEEQC